MSTKGDVNGTSTTNIYMVGGNKNRKGKKCKKDNEEVYLDPRPSTTLTSHPPSNTEASNDEWRKTP